MKRKWIFETLLHEIENRWTAAKHWIPKLNSLDFDALDTFLNIILSIDMLKSNDQDLKFSKYQNLVASSVPSTYIYLNMQYLFSGLRQTCMQFQDLDVSD